MTFVDDEFDVGSFLVGLLVAAFTVGILMQAFGINKWHDRTCQEQFSHAVTASDTLLIIRQDAYCNTELDR